MAKPLKGTVSVVIINYNGKLHISKCIRSVLLQSYSPIEIIVIDNASTDGSFEEIKREFPQIRLLQTGYNAGWGIACNAGIHASESEYVVLLNNDAYMDAGCISEMVKAVNLDPSYGSCASRILLSDDPDTTEVCGLVIHKDGSSCGRGRLKPADTFLQTEEVFCANDCCCLYKRTMLEEIGDYDPDFFLYCDETDMGWKHQFAGWKCIYTPNALAYHAHSKAAGSYSILKAFHVERNRIYICMKYFPVGLFLLSFPRSFLRYLAQVYYSLFRKKGALSNFQKEHSLFYGLWVLIQAHAVAFFKFQKMWAKRSEIRKIKKISNAQMMQLFNRFGISLKNIASYE